MPLQKKPHLFFDKITHAKKFCQHIERTDACDELSAAAGVNPLVSYITHFAENIGGLEVYQPLGITGLDLTQS